MADLYCRGLDELMEDLRAIMQLPNNVQDDMLRAMAEETAQGQRRMAEMLGVRDTGKTIKSIKPGKIKLDKHRKKVIYVTPVGRRVRGKDRSRKVRNAEIAYINEYGKSRQRARPFVRKGNEQSSDRSLQAAMEIYNRYLAENNL